MFWSSGFTGNFLKSRSFHRALAKEISGIRRFKEINNFEDICGQNGTIVLKFFGNVSKKEQKESISERG